LNDRQETIGTTLHYITDATIDTGDIIEISKIKANYQTSLFDNIYSIYQQGIVSIIKTIETFNHGEVIKTYRQNLLEGRYFSAPTLDEIEYFKQNIMPVYT
jgi:methionyl-tRNA formyltransferase